MSTPEFSGRHGGRRGASSCRSDEVARVRQQLPPPAKETQIVHAADPALLRSALEAPDGDPQDSREPLA
jgi:hypothetical protein